MANVPRSTPRPQPAQADRCAPAGAVSRRARRRALVVNHRDGSIRNAAVFEIGRAGMTTEHARNFLRVVNGPRPAPAQDAPDSAWTDLVMRPGGWRDDQGRFPFVRFGHPVKIFRLDLEGAGATIGHVEADSAWLDGDQVRATVRVHARAPIDSWERTRAAILTIAATATESIGLSTFMPAGLPLYVDLVDAPAANLNGLAGSPRAGVRSIGRPAALRFLDEMAVRIGLEQSRRDFSEAVAAARARADPAAAAAAPQHDEQPDDRRAGPRRRCPACGIDFDVLEAEMRVPPGDPDDGSKIEYRCPGCGRWQHADWYVTLMPTGVRT